METKHGDILLYESAGLPAIEVRLERETVWVSQKQMALLFDTERSVITKHLRNIFNSGELEEKSNVQKMHIPQLRGWQQAYRGRPVSLVLGEESCALPREWRPSSE